MPGNKEIELRFTYHRPEPHQIPKYELVRNRGREFANLLNDMCPDSPELETAINKIEEAVMWANAAIARRFDKGSKDRVTKVER